ncbi:acyltransferase family protein [Sarcina ventriculi]
MKNREFNILKGLGIIAVVIGHSSWRFGKIFDPYSFHMALFIFISGYFYKTTYEDNFILFIKNKTKSLVIPYFIYNFFMLF